MDLNNLIFVFFLVILGLLFYKYFPLFLKRNNFRFLIDDQYKKAQAFHESPIPTVGGIGIFLLLIIVYVNFLFFNNVTLFDYLSFGTLFFVLGFADDIKINIKPKIRLILMIIFLVLLIKYNNFYLEKTGIEILDNFLKNSEIFSLFFICLCFLFIINGANLIDGYNGLLTIHSIIILLNLSLVNYFGENIDLSIFLFFVVIILLIFLKFNFPIAKIFLGDGGSYMLGAFIALSAIKTSIANPSISPFYFCMLLFYLFFEVFFSFFRKLIIEKMSPMHPDGKHLHMLLYKILLKKNNNKAKSNYYVSLFINMIFLILIIPAILKMDDGLFCKYYSIVFFIIYLSFYKIMHEKIK